MAANHKLTAVIKGRTIASTANANDVLTIGFTDGSKMTVKTQGSANTGATGGTVKAVRQKGNDLHLDMEDGATLSVQTAEPTSSVMLRSKTGEMEYAD